MSEEWNLPNGSQRWPIDPGEPTTRQPRISVAPEEGRYLRRLFRGKFVLEIGTGLGVSTSYLAQSAQHVLTVDVDPWVHNTVWPELRELYKNITFIKDAGGLRLYLFGGAFIDGSHHYHDVNRDVALASDVVRPGGWIVMHDAGHGDIVQAVKDNGYTMRIVKTTWQLGVFKCR